MFSRFVNAIRRWNVLNTVFTAELADYVVSLGNLRCQPFYDFSREFLRVAQDKDSSNYSLRCFYVAAKVLGISL